MKISFFVLLFTFSSFANTVVLNHCESRVELEEFQGPNNQVILIRNGLTCRTQQQQQQQTHTQQGSSQQQMQQYQQRYYVHGQQCQQQQIQNHSRRYIIKTIDNVRQLWNGEAAYYKGILYKCGNY